MKVIRDVNPAQAYIEGMLWAAYGVKIFSDSVAEWQIDQVKECAMKLKETEIDHSDLTPTEKVPYGGKPFFVQIRKPFAIIWKFLKKNISFFC